MGYLATEIIILLAAAAVLGLVIGWALFGLGKPKAAATSAANPKLEADLKAALDARKKAETRIVELEAKETNFTDKLQERDTKIAELSHQLDDQAKYRVQSAMEVETRQQRIAALEATLLEKEAELAKASAHAHHEAQPIDERLAERDRLIARYKSDLESALTAASPDVGRLQQLERENAELRATLVETAGAAPTTSGEKDQIIARLNEEITGLRAAYEAAEQALEEQDAAIDKLTRDLQATQHKLASAEGREVPVVARPKPAPAPVVEPARPAPAAPAEASEATVAVSLDALVAQIEAKVEAPAVAAKAPVAPTADDANESTVAVSLDDLVAQIDAKAPAAPEPAPAPAPVHDDANESTVAVSLDDLVAQIDAKPAAAPAEVKAATPVAPAADDANESTVAVSLDDLVAQIDAKAPAAPVEVQAPAPVAPVAPAPAHDDANESTVAVSLEDLVAQIDSKAEPAAEAPPIPAAPPIPPVPMAPPIPAAAPADDANESTLAVSLEDLVAQIDAAPPVPVAPPVPAAKPTPPAAIDAGESTVAISLADLIGAIDNEPSVSLGVAPAPAGANDDLQRIIGIGPNAASRLQGAGIRTWKQVAELSDADLEQVAALLKVSVDKIKREQWIEQARALLS